MISIILATSGFNSMTAGSRLQASRMLRSSAPAMVSTVESGEFGTTDYTMTFMDGDKVTSPYAPTTCSNQAGPHWKSSG